MICSCVGLGGARYFLEATETIPDEFQTEEGLRLACEPGGNALIMKKVTK
jgi:hypothetical protein